MVVWLIFSALVAEDLDLCAADDEVNFMPALPAVCLPFKELSFLLAGLEEAIMVGVLMAWLDGNE